MTDELFSLPIILQNNRQQPLIDVVVLLVSLPCLMIFGLLLEANTRGNWQQNSDSWFTVLGLGIGLALVALAICGYVTHRMGVCINCLWAGPQHDDVDQESYYVSISLSFNCMN